MTTFSAPGIDQQKADFITAFYKTSDERDAVDKYVEFLTPDVEFVMGLRAMKGHEAVRQLRRSMWQGIKSRKHAPIKAYSLDQNASEIMLFGTVTYGLEKKGHEPVDVEWAARMVFAPGPQLKMSLYQVWMDGSPLKEALSK